MCLSTCGCLCRRVFVAIETRKGEEEKDECDETEERGLSCVTYCLGSVTLGSRHSSLCLYVTSPPPLFQRKMWRTDTQTTGRKQDHRAGNFLRFHWETALITPIFPPTASTELQGFKQYSISLTCYHAGQLLCPGDGVDTACHYNGWSYFPGVSFFPICSEDGCKSLLIQGIHNVSSAGHVEVPTHKEKPN